MEGIINLSLVYKKKKKTRLFGNKFVKNNISKCKIIFKNKEYKLTEFYKHNKFPKNKGRFIHIDLKIVQEITDASHMFDGCNKLISLQNLNNWNTSRLTKIDYMFRGCRLITSLPDISGWDTSNISSMKFLFSDCTSLRILPDISKWDTSKVINLNGMFHGIQIALKMPAVFFKDVYH